MRERWGTKLDLACLQVRQLKAEVERMKDESTPWI